MEYENNYKTSRSSDGTATSCMEQITAALKFNSDGIKNKALKILVICLVCIILAGAMGVAGGLLVYGYRDFAIIEGSSGLSLKKADTDLSFSGLVTKADSGAKISNLTGELTATDIYNLACNSCVGVTTSITTTNAFGQETGSAITGSGFIISSDGLVLTNYHVVQAADESGLEILIMLYNGGEYKAEIVGRDSENDIALLRIDAKNLLPIRTGDFNTVKVGETVYAIGNPLGELTYTMTSGIVSALDRSITVETNMPINMFQIDAAINSGNSGGPVLNSRGEVIGIASAKYSSAGVEGLGFAIPINDALSIADSLLKYGYVKGRPLFGITVYTVVKDYDAKVDGACIASVEAGSCSETAGLLIGDIVTEIDGIAIASSSDLIAAKKAHKAGDTVVLTVYRGGEYVTVSVTLDEAGAPPSAEKSETDIGAQSGGSHSEYGSGGGR